MYNQQQSSRKQQHQLRPGTATVIHFDDDDTDSQQEQKQQQQSRQQKQQQQSRRTDSQQDQQQSRGTVIPFDTDSQQDQQQQSRRMDRQQDQQQQSRRTDRQQYQQQQSRRTDSQQEQHQQTRDCLEWLNNPLINPVTRRKITKKGKIYKNYQSMCEKLVHLPTRRQVTPQMSQQINSFIKRSSKKKSRYLASYDSKFKFISKMTRVIQKYIVNGT